MYAHILSRLFNKPLLVVQPRLDEIVRAMIPRLVDGSGIRLQHGEGIEEPEIESEKTAAIIPVHGTLVNRAGRMTPMSEPLMSYETLNRWIDSAIADDGVGHVVLDIDTSGGEASGAFDVSDLIFNHRGTKPITAIVNDRALSAGYAIASAADTVIVSRTGEVGSVGVVAVHLDESERDKERGLTYTYVFAGDQKVDFNSHHPLTDNAETRLQAEVDRLYDLFVETVARNRGLTTKAVRDTQAGVFSGANAVQIGFSDQVEAARTALHNIINPQPTGVLTMSGSQVTTQTPESTATAGMVSTADVQAIINACNQAGLPGLAGRAISENVAVDDLSKLFNEAKQITEACETALLPGLANNAIAAGQTLIQVKADLFDKITAENSAFRKSETVTSKAEIIAELVRQDEDKPTSTGIAADAGYDATKNSGQAQGPTANIQESWDAAAKVASA